MNRKIVLVAATCLVMVSACAKNPMSTNPISASHGSSPSKAFAANMPIEAEMYNQQSGIQTESCSEGGQNVGWIEDGDFLEYDNINFGTGTNQIQVRVASASNGGSIEVHLDSQTGPLVGTVSVPGTNGWQTWISREAALNLTSGVHAVYLVFRGGSGALFNLNWFAFGYSSAAVSAFSTIEAENSSLQSGTQTENCAEGGLNVGWINPANYRAYSNIDFGSKANYFIARVASQSNGGTIEIRLDSLTGTRLGTLAVGNTGGWQNWGTREIGLSAVNGVHTVYLVFNGAGDGLFNLNWFTFADRSQSLDMFGENAVSGDMSDGISTITHSRYNRGLVTTFSAGGWNGWCGVWIKLAGGNPKDLSGYNGLRFKAYSTEFQPWIHFEITDNNGNHQMGYIYAHWTYNTPQYNLVGEMPRTWAEYAIPFSAFGNIDLSSVKEFKLVFYSGLLGFPPPLYNQPMPVHSTVYIDEMRFVNDL